MARLNLQSYSDLWMHFKETITLPNTGAAAVSEKRNINVIFKNCAPFINCISDT